jgi:glycosidase
MRVFLRCLSSCVRVVACLGVVLACGLATAERHTFTFDAPPGTRTVHLAGSFNGWSSTATPMLKDGGRFALTLDLPEGVHHYKFVLDGTHWVTDPASDRELEQSDGHGGVNSAVFIGLDARRFPEPRPSHVYQPALRHDPADDVRVIEDGSILVDARALTGDVQRAELLLIGLDPDGGPRTLPMTRVGSRLNYDRFRAQADDLPDRVRYAFRFHDGDDTATLNGEGRAFDAGTASDVLTPDWARDAVWYQVFPERFRNGDPSNDPGDAEFETLLPWTSDWWQTHTAHGEAAGDHHFYTGHGNVWRRRYGGDLAGLTEMLPYLRCLGVNAIYLNPVFEADSMHKYDTSDFRHIDDHFGTRGDWPVAGETDDPATWTWTPSDRAFLDFLAQARRQSFRVIIDGVFNHVGHRHFAFQDVLRNGRDSRYADWFAITDWGDPENVGRPESFGKPGGIQWVAWDQPNGALPAFAKDDALGLAQGPRQHIFDITRRWMDPDGDGDPADGIDGWRLDVPGDIPHPFWRDWRSLVKSINPDAYLSGEIWGPAQPWLNEGDQFDAVMNYQFAMPAVAFFADRRDPVPARDFMMQMLDVVSMYPLPIALVQQNLYASHDTDRLASMFVNPDRPYDGRNRLQDTGPDYDRSKPGPEARARQRLAVGFQMAFLGAPMIYYGDEAGMWGPDDPSDRMPMLWRDLEPYDGQQPEVDDDMHAWYRHMIAVRHAEPALRRGTFRPRLDASGEDLAVFTRTLGDRSVHVLLNRSASSIEATLAVGNDTTWVDLADPQTVEIVEHQGKPFARPTVRPTDDAVRRTANPDGKLTLTVEPWTIRVLAPDVEPSAD